MMTLSTPHPAESTDQLHGVSPRSTWQRLEQRQPLCACDNTSRHRVPPEDSSHKSTPSRPHNCCSDKPRADGGKDGRDPTPPPARELGEAGRTLPGKSEEAARSQDSPQGAQNRAGHGWAAATLTQTGARVGRILVTSPAAHTSLKEPTQPRSTARRARHNASPPGVAETASRPALGPPGARPEAAGAT